jgi:hypothetical protein
MAGKRRDEFLDDTKDLLAKRVGMRCSNPNCRQPTSGPNAMRGFTVAERANPNTAKTWHKQIMDQVLPLAHLLSGMPITSGNYAIYRNDFTTLTAQWEHAKAEIESIIAKVEPKD